MNMDAHDEHLRSGPMAGLGSLGPVISSDLDWGTGEVADDYSCEAIPRLFCWIMPEHQRARARHLAGLTQPTRQ